MSRLRWPDSTNSVSEKPGTIQFRLEGDQDLEGSIEALLYLTTLCFWIGVIGSLVLIGRIGGRNSSSA